MFPSFDLGPLSFPSYFTLLMLGFLAAIFLAARVADRIGVDPNHVLDAGIWAVVFGIVGSRALHVVADGYFMDYVHLCTDSTQVEPKKLPGEKPCTSDQQCVTADRGEICAVDRGTCHPDRDCLRAFKFWYGGLTYYGGFLAAALFLYFYVKRLGYPVWRFGDVTGFAIPLGLVFGRIGCYLAGCCFGNRSDSWLAVSFPKDSPAWVEQGKAHLLGSHAHESLAVLPTQLYESAGTLLVFLVCFWMYLRRRTYDGKVFWWFVLLYAVLRYTVEIWRGDQRGEWVFGLFSTSQAIALPCIAVALVMLPRLKRRSPPPHELPDAPKA